MKSATAVGHRGRNGKSVSTTNTGGDSANEKRGVTPDRYDRALTELRSVTFTAPGVADVAQGVTTYEVELGGGVCTCDDYHYRGDRVLCKHVIRAALAALFAEDQQNSELVARVARYAHDAGCPHGIEACNGPTCGADRPDGLPCQGCVEAVKSDQADEWAVWNAPGARSVRRQRQAQGQVRTDGGERR